MEDGKNHGHYTEGAVSDGTNLLFLDKAPLTIFNGSGECEEYCQNSCEICSYIYY